MSVRVLPPYFPYPGVAGQAGAVHRARAGWSGAQGQGRRNRVLNWNNGVFQRRLASGLTSVLVREKKRKGRKTTHLKSFISFQAQLDNMEKRTQGVESDLSVLSHVFLPTRRSSWHAGRPVSSAPRQRSSREGRGGRLAGRGRQVKTGDRPSRRSGDIQVRIEVTKKQTGRDSEGVTSLFVSPERSFQTFRTGAWV